MTYLCARKHHKSPTNDMDLFCFGFALNKNMLKFVLVLWFVVLVPIVNVVCWCNRFAEYLRTKLLTYNITALLDDLVRFVT
jgi:hypothetical protein